MDESTITGLKIKLSNGEHTIVDADDYAYLSKWEWYKDNRGYARRAKYINGKRVAYLMHRVINKTPQGMDTDHINRNKLDNRKINLRSCTRSMNLYNTPIRSDNKSGYKGISWNKGSRKWVVQIGIGYGKRFYKRYKTIEEAIFERRKAEIGYGYLIYE